MEEVCARFPLLPRVWLELGQCHGAKPDRERQIQALSEVRTMSPGWGWGMRLLADALKKAGRYEEALDVMRQAARHSPWDAWNLGWQAEIEWHLGDRSSAIEHVRKAVELEPGYNWAWNSLRDWGALIGQPETARHAAQALTRERPAEARSWLILADMLTEARDFTERLAAFDRAIAAAPRSVTAYEDKARILGLAGRFDEAFEVCESHPDPVQPAMLIAREAWLLWCKHEPVAAISRMRGALAADSALPWGWTQLAEWHQERKEYAEAEEALVHLCQLEPDDPAHLGRLASVREKREDSAGSVSALERALLISPDYGFALRRLIDHHCKHQRFAEARQLIEESRPHYAPSEYLSRLSCWHLAQSQASEAGEVVLRLIEDPDTQEHSFNRILEQIRAKSDPKALRRLAKQLERALRKAEIPSSQGGLFYVKLMHHLQAIPRWQVVRRILPEDDGGLGMMMRYIEGIGDRWKKAARTDSSFSLSGWPEWRRLDQLIRKRREVLRKHDDLWGTIGYALHSMDRNREVAAWLADWRERADLEPYMLNNLFFSLQKLGRDQESLSVLARGLELPRHDEITMRFHLYAAIEDFLQGRTEEALKHLSFVHEPDLKSYSRATLGLVNVLKELQPGMPKRPFDAKPIEAFLSENTKNRTAQRLVTRACALMSRHNGNWYPRLWLLLHRHWIALTITSGFLFVVIKEFWIP
jgi:tetratricopeptide (TPR) repeat protein